MDKIFVAPDSAVVLNGNLIPGETFVKALVDQLREDINSDPTLRQQWEQDPRAVMGARGIVKDLQTEIMLEQDIPTEQAMSDWCISTSSCCCTTV